MKLEGGNENGLGNSKTERVFGLDILRSIAILSVLIGHGGFLLPIEWQRFNQIFALDGVGIFFVLSGYLIGTIFIQKTFHLPLSIHALMQFLIRRWFRTLPNYYFVLILLVVLNVIYNPNFTLFSVHRFFLFTQNFWRPHSTWFFPESWSLAVEEWFYLLFPLITWCLAHFCGLNRKNILIVVILIFIMVPMGVRWYRFEVSGPTDLVSWDLDFRKQVITQLDSIMFGVLGAYGSLFYPHLWKKYAKSLFIIGLMVFIFDKYFFYHLIQPFGFWHSVFSFSFLSTAILFMLPFLQQFKRKPGILVNVVTTVSLISYSLYLIHLSLVQTWILPALPLSDYCFEEKWLPFVKYIVYITLSIGLAYLQFRFFEKPMTDLREKWTDAN
jgi:peptidoglycan/LPS O-acetylase OafA/YrhL